MLKMVILMVAEYVRSLSGILAVDETQTLSLG